MQFQTDLDFAKSLDTQSPESLRDNFILPQHNGRDAIYFLGNSLGLQPKSTEDYLKNILQTWATIGVEGFFKGDDPWLQYHDKLIQPLARIVGALPEEVVVMNSLTVNLHLMLVSFYQPAGKRIKIICEEKAFPSDQYMLETHIRQRGLDPEQVLIEVGPRAGDHTISEEDILSAIEENGDTLALVFFGGVNYYTGQVFDMQAITAKAHAAGAKAGFDLAHAAGNIALKLHEWDVDFACWCSYKYLNSGPGAIGGAYIHQRYHKENISRFAGWWGYKKDERFLMQKGFVPMETAEGWNLSTPSLLLYAAHNASLQLFEEAGMSHLHQKGKALSSYLLFLLNGLNNKFGSGIIEVITPQEEHKRGCQVSMLMLQNGKKVFQELSRNGIFADWREPDVIRIAPVPMYNTFEEIWKFVNSLEEACKKYIQ